MSFIKSIGWTIITIIIICISGKAFAGIREILIAKYFGVGAITDSFVVAASIPCRLGLMVGMMSYTALIPIYTSYALTDREDATRLFNACFVILTSGLILITLLILFNACWFVQLLAPGMSPSAKIGSAKMLEIMAGTLALLGMSSLLRSVNSINQRYIISSLYDPSTNLIHLVVMIILIPFLGIYGVAVGLLIGAAGQLLLQGVGFFRKAPFYSLKSDFSHPGIKEFMLSLFPLVATVAIVEVNYFIMRAVASMLPVGAISALYFSFTVTYFPLGILDLIIITMLFPFIAALVNQNRLAEVGRITNDMVNGVTFLLLPLSALIIILRGPIIEILFQRGAFDVIATQKTSFALGLFSIGLFAWGLDYLFFRLYYLLKMMKAYIMLLLARVAINILLNIILIKYLMHGGIALAFSIALVVYLFMSVIVLKRRLTHFDARGVVLFSLKALIMCIIMSSCVFFADRIMGMPSALSNNVFGKLMHVTLCGAVGVIIYLLCARLIIANELGIFLGLLKLKTVRLTSIMMGAPRE